MKNERSIVSITSENYEGTRPERRRQAKRYLYTKKLKGRKETLFSGITRAMRRLIKRDKLKRDKLKRDKQQRSK